MDTRVYYAIINMGYNVSLFYIRLWTTSDIIQRHYYLPRNIIYSKTLYFFCFQMEQDQENEIIDATNKEFI